MTKFVTVCLQTLTLGSLYALIALGYTLVYGVLRFINFAHSDVVTIGAWLAFVFAGALGWAGSDSPLFGEPRARIVGALAVLLDAGRVDGTVRTDIDAEDVMRAMGAVWLVPDGAEWDAQVRRLLGLVVDGPRFGV